jgi:hypothetical protein
MWWFADGGGVEQPDGSFLHLRTHTPDPKPPYSLSVGNGSFRCTKRHWISRRCAIHSLLASVWGHGLSKLLRAEVDQLRAAYPLILLQHGHRTTLVHSCLLRLGAPQEVAWGKPTLATIAPLDYDRNVELRL